MNVELSHNSRGNTCWKTDKDMRTPSLPKIRDLRIDCGEDKLLWPQAYFALSMTESIWTRQIQHFWILLPHVGHVQRCPHGTKTRELTEPIQMTHSGLTSNSLTGLPLAALCFLTPPSRVPCKSRELEAALPWDPTWTPWLVSAASVTSTMLVLFML